MSLPKLFGSGRCCVLCCEMREGQDPPLHFMYRYRAVSRRTFISLSVRCALSAGTAGGGSRPSPTFYVSIPGGTRGIFVSLSARCALSAALPSEGQDTPIQESRGIVAVKMGCYKILCLHERQLCAIERFSVLHENNLFFCIIVLDKSLKGW